MKKKLIICIPSLRLGGAAKIALNLAEYYMNNNVHVTIILIEGSAQQHEFQDIPPGVDVIKLPDLNTHKSIKLLFVVSKLTHLFKSIKPDAILSVRHTATVASGLAWKLASKPGSFFIREINPITKTLNRKKIMIKLLKMAYSSADAVIANSTDVAAALRSLNWMDPSKIFAVDNPVITKGFFQKSKEPKNDLWIDASDAPLFITIGRLDPMKDHQSLIRAFALVRAKTDCRLLIIGDGAEYENLTELINSLNLSKEIKLAGSLENPYPYLKHADVFVLTSLYEGFGNVLVEALSLGKKVISTDCSGGPAYILNNGEFGTLVKVGDIEAIAQAMHGSLKEQVCEEKQRTRGQEFSIEEVGKRYSKIMFATANSPLIEKALKL